MSEPTYTRNEYEAKEHDMLCASKRTARYPESCQVFDALDADRAKAKGVWVSIGDQVRSPETRKNLEWRLVGVDQFPDGLTYLVVQSELKECEFVGLEDLTTPDGHPVLGIREAGEFDAADMHTAMKNYYNAPGAPDRNEIIADIRREKLERGG